MDASKADDLGALHVKLRQGGGQRHGFSQPVFGQAAGFRGFQCRVQDIGARRRCRRVAQALAIAGGENVVVVVVVAGDQSSPS